MTLLRLERRWLQAILEAFTPSDGPGIAPRPGEVDYQGVIDQMLRASNARARVGLRAGIWLAALSPVWLTGRLATMAGVAMADRSALLARMLTHRALVVRGLVTLLKLTASFALFINPALRERSHYDRRAPAVDPGRRVLPVVTEATEVQEAT